MTNKKTLNTQEVEKFSKMADQWWKPNGSFKPLHMMNPIRLQYIKNMIESHFPKKKFTSISIIDAGCGGGLVSEPLARIGFNVTGIDASSENIEVAKQHAQDNDVNVSYSCTTIEDLAATKIKYDVVLALEIIEHVDNVEYFISSLAQLAKNGGLIIFSTLNKTVKSYLFSIIGAEYIARILPIGTHQYEKFIKPSELVKMAQKGDLVIQDLKGMEYNLLKKSWSLTDNIDINYFACFVKN